MRSRGWVPSVLDDGSTVWRRSTSEAVGGPGTRHAGHRGWAAERAERRAQTAPTAQAAAAVAEPPRSPEVREKVPPLDDEVLDAALALWTVPADADARTDGCGECDECGECGECCERCAG